MKQVRCINPKSYNLTLNQEYTVANQPNSRGRYNVTNDAGRRAPYDYRLFEDVEEVVPVPAPVRPDDTVEQVISTVRAQSTGDNILITVTRDEVPLRITVSPLSEEGTNISCGVRQLYNINLFTNRIIDQLIADGSYPEPELRQAIVTAAYSEAIARIASCAFIVLSTNINTTNANYILGALDRMATVSSVAVNPNSSNDIKMWVIDVSDEFIEEDDEDTE